MLLSLTACPEIHPFIFFGQFVREMNILAEEAK